MDAQKASVGVKEGGKKGRSIEEATKEDILAFLEGKIARWWMPDDVVFVSEIPHTATGKISKLTLRKRFEDYKLKPSRAGGDGRTRAKL